MTANQLRLLLDPRPLVVQLGEEFFRQVPRSPGVYRMFGDGDRLLYVGKAGELRSRLSSYRRTHGQSRKTIRLLHAVRRIEWEVCPSESEARLLENLLIRTHRPPFNRQGTWPRSARYVTLATRGSGFELALTAEPVGESYGVFRGVPALALVALGRLLWLAWLADHRPEVLPRRLLITEGLRSFVGDHPAACSWLAEIREFLAGESDALLARLVAAIPEPEIAFHRQFLAFQFEVAMEFYRHGPLRHRRWRALLPPGRSLIAPEEHDDLRVLADSVVENRVPPWRPAD